MRTRRTRRIAIMLIRFPLVLFAALLGARQPAAPLPWIDSGHRIIAAWTWAELTPGTRTQLAGLLRSHPRYEQDLLHGLAEGSSEEAKARHAFLQAAVWPDTVRDLRHPLRRTHNQPRWHYKDIPFAVDGVAAEVAVAKGDGPRDVVEALVKSRAELLDAKLPAADRAVALCWVLHLSADIHQPLHACTMYSAAFPGGDKGGNEFHVQKDARYDNTRFNLHYVWDSLLGQYLVAETDISVAAGLALRPDLARQAFGQSLAELDPAAWVQESHLLCRKHVYRDGELRPKAGSGDSKDKPQVLPEGYVENAERIAVQQAARAAYRTADQLNAAFAAK